MAGRFSKTGAPYLSMGKYLNGNNATGDTVIGGQITAAPSGLNVSQFQQNIPGDRFIFTPSDALALSNNNVGTLYTGTYRYVASRNNSTSGPVRGCAAFWDPTAAGANNNISSPAADGLYQVTSDGNAANYTNSLFAGVFINAFTKGNYWFIQEAGKAACKFVNVLSGTPAIGNPVYLQVTAAANNNATDNGAFDILDGGNSAAIFAANSTTAYTTVGAMISKYIGVAETIPSNNNISLVNIAGGRAFWRW